MINRIDCPACGEGLSCNMCGADYAGPSAEDERAQIVAFLKHQHQRAIGGPAALGYILAAENIEAGLHRLPGDLAAVEYEIGRTDG